MNIKKLVSAVSSLAIAGSMFAGLAVTASAATYTALDSQDVTLSTGYNDISVTQNVGETLVHEFDIKVDDGVTLTLAYYNGTGTLGTTYYFDAADLNGGGYTGQTIIGFVTGKMSSGTYNELNSSHAYSYYATGATAHVVIETPVTSYTDTTSGTTYQGLGNSTVTVTPATDDDKESFMQEKSDGSYTQRNPYNGSRAISSRNLYNKSWNKINLGITVSDSADEGATATISNEVIYRKAANVTVSADNATISGIDNLDDGVVALNTYSATITADEGYAIDSVTVNDAEVTAADDGTYSITVTDPTAIVVTTSATTTTQYFQFDQDATNTTTYTSMSITANNGTNDATSNVVSFEDLGMSITSITVDNGADVVFGIKDIPAGITLTGITLY